VNEEPTYEFVRGVGWVPCNGALNRVFVSTRHGNFYLELREPKIGERYATFYKNDTKYVKDGALQLAVFKNYLETNTDWYIGSYSLCGQYPLSVSDVRCTFVFE
jgi:hypothetical protein